MAILAVVSAVAYALLSLVMPYLQCGTAVMTALVLSAIGMSASASGAIVQVQGLPLVEIVPLCVGDLELAILLGGIAATEDRTLKERAWGVIGGTVFVLLVNPLRIALTLSAGVHWGMTFMDFLHSFLFRVTLVAVIVGFYVAWYLGLPLLKSKFKKN